MAAIQDYLSIPFFDYGAILEQRFNVAPKAKIDPEIKIKLQAFFKIPNQQLAKFLNQPLPKEWEG